MSLQASNAEYVDDLKFIRDAYTVLLDNLNRKVEGAPQHNPQDLIKLTDDIIIAANRLRDMFSQQLLMSRENVSSQPISSEKSKFECPPTKDPIIIDLKTIWKTHLYPWTKTPEFEKLLKDQLGEESGLTRGDEKHWNDFFRLSKQDFDRVTTLDKPWLHYPLAVFSPIEDPEKYKTNKHYEWLKSQYDDFLSIMSRAKSPEDIEWWVWISRCETINGLLLLHLLRKAFPQKRFTIINNGNHYFVVDEICQIYDLYWGPLGIKDYYFDDKGKQLKLEYFDEYPAHLFC